MHPGLYSFTLRTNLRPFAPVRSFPSLDLVRGTSTSGSDYELLVMHRKCVDRFVRFELTASSY